MAREWEQVWQDSVALWDPLRRTKASSRRLTASAPRPLSGAAERQRWASAGSSESCGSTDFSEIPRAV